MLRNIILLLTGLLVLCSPIFGQGSFYATGLSAYPQSTPHPTGWAAIAIPANKQLYSFTEYDVQMVGKPLAVQTSTRTGLATPCKTMGATTVYCLGDAGAATAGPSVSAAFAAGAVAAIPIKGWYVLAGFRVLQIPSPVQGGRTTSRIIEIGLGRSVSK